MPRSTHSPEQLRQGIAHLLQDDPWLAFDIFEVRDAPRGAVELEARAPNPARRGPDLVLVHRDPHEPERGAVLTVEVLDVVEQGRRWSFSAYQAEIAAEHRLGTWIVLVSLAAEVSETLRAWAAGGPPRLDALVLDVETVSLRWLEHPHERPTAAALAGALHGHAGNLDAARRAIEALRIEHPRYAATVLAALPDAEAARLSPS